MWQKTWSILNEVLKKGKNWQPITSIFHENNLIPYCKQVADIFNKFFTTIADEIASLINPTAAQDTFRDDNMTKDTNEDITTVKMSYIPVTGNKPWYVLIN
jgi:hypothetical protein